MGPLGALGILTGNLPYLAIDRMMQSSSENYRRSHNNSGSAGIFVSGEAPAIPPVAQTQKVIEIKLNRGSFVVSLDEGKAILEALKQIFQAENI